MRIEVICTGDEVLTGKIVNTNFSYITQKLEDFGLSVRWETTVGDDREDLLLAFQLAGSRADAVIVNGGLGPTVDDLSQEIAAKAAGVELVLSDEWLSRMEAYFARRSRVMPPNNTKQAMLPAGAEVLDAVAHLRREDVPGTQKIGIWGTSRGGWVAPMALAQDPADVVLVNDDDLTYTKVRLDAGTTEVVTAHLDRFVEPLPRALVWSSAWDMVRDGELPAHTYADMVERDQEAEGEVMDRARQFGEHLLRRVVDEHFYDLLVRPRVLLGQHVPGIGLNQVYEQNTVPQLPHIKAAMQSLATEAA